MREDIKHMFNTQIMIDFEKYLGLPMVRGKNKVNTFKDLRERIAKRIIDWKAKFISKVTTTKCTFNHEN